MSRSAGPLSREGMSLIELLVSVIIFGVTMLLAGRFIVQFAHQVGISEAQAQATEFAHEELERIKLLPTNEIAASPPTPIPEAPEFIRKVEVQVVGGEPADLWSYQVITVEVAPPEGVKPVRLSTAIAQ